MIVSVLLGVSSLSRSRLRIAPARFAFSRNLNISNSNQALTKSKPSKTIANEEREDNGYDAIRSEGGTGIDGLTYADFHLDEASISLLEQSGFKVLSYEDKLDRFLDSGRGSGGEGVGTEDSNTSEAWDEARSTEYELKLKVKKEKKKVSKVRVRPSSSAEGELQSTRPQSSSQHISTPKYTPSLSPVHSSTPINLYRPNLTLSKSFPQPHEYPLRNRFDWRLSSPLLKTSQSVFMPGTRFEPPSLRKSWILPWKKVGINKLVGIGLDPARESKINWRNRSTADESWARKKKLMQDWVSPWISADLYIEKQERLLDLTIKAEEVAYQIELRKQGTPLERYQKGSTLPSAIGSWQGSSPLVNEQLEKIRLRADSLLAQKEEEQGIESKDVDKDRLVGSAMSIWECTDETVISEDQFPAFTVETTLRFTPLNQLTQATKSSKESYHQGRLLEIKDGRLLVAFELSDMFEIEGEYRIDIGRDETTIRLQRAALQSLYCDPAKQRLDNLGKVEEAQVHFEKSGTDPEMSQWTLKGTDLRELIVPDFSTEESYYNPLAKVGADFSSSSALWDDPNFDTIADFDVEDQNLTPLVPSEVTPLATISTDRTLSQNPSSIFSDNQLINSWIKRYRSENPLELPGDPDLGLNRIQIRAVAMALDESISLIQGPPGTGKSSTIVSLIQLLKVHFRHPTPILLAAPTHVAVDLLLDLLVEARLNPLRTGKASKVRPELRKWTIDKRREEHPLWDQVELARGFKEERRVEIAYLRDQLMVPNLIRKKQESLEEELKSALIKYRKATARYAYLQNRLYSSLLSTADVFVTTALGAGKSQIVDCIDFPVVFIDEAAMCTEPVTLIPIMKGARHVTLIGDHKQLPAVMTSKLAQAERLHVSLFERLMSSDKVNTVLLSTQYRMRPKISEFPNRSFYDGKLSDGLAVLERGPPPKSQYFNIQPDSIVHSPHVFINHEYRESNQDNSTVNKVEVKIILQIVGDLLKRNPDLSSKDIGIIAFYAAQTKLLRETFDYDAPDILRPLLGRDKANTLPQVEVNTVDGFQGREKSIIILSTVRSNSGGFIGFLKDKRRLNVALTRAKDGLVVVGNRRTLVEAAGNGNYSRDLDQDSDIWRRYLKWAQDNGLYKDWTG